MRSPANVGSFKIPQDNHPLMIIKSPYAEVHIPELALTPFVLQRASEHGDKPALIDGPTGRCISYAQLSDAIAKGGANLCKRAFKKGEVCGIFTPTIPEYAIAFHSVATLGGVVTRI